MGFAKLESPALPPITDKVRAMSDAWNAEWDHYVIGTFTSGNTPVSVFKDDEKVWGPGCADDARLYIMHRCVEAALVALENLETLPEDKA